MISSFPSGCDERGAGGDSFSLTCRIRENDR